MNELDGVFKELGISSPAKLGREQTSKSRRDKAEHNYTDRRVAVIAALERASRARSESLRLMNSLFYVIIGVMVVSVVVEFFTNRPALIATVQSACTLAIFPISRRIDRNATSQAYIEFVAAFLPDLDPSSAVKAIDTLYHALDNPRSIKDAVVARPASDQLSSQANNTNRDHQ